MVIGERFNDRARLVTWRDLVVSLKFGDCFERQETGGVNWLAFLQDIKIWRSKFSHGLGDGM